MSKNIDDRIFSLVKYSNYVNHRCFFVLIGEHTKVHIPAIYNILSSNSTRSVESIIWCHKNKNIVKEVKTAQNSEEDQSKLNEFFKAQDIQFVSYNESEKILGQTVDMLILQDFESLTPNLIALSVETVRGGGIIVLLLDNVNSIESMIKRKSDFLLDDDFVPRYNKRLFRSLIDMKFTLFLDDAFKVLPISKFNLDASNLKSIKNKEIKSESEILDSDKCLINLAKTKDQNLIVKELIKAVKDRTERSIYSIQAGRGRGKSVALGIAISKAIDLKFSSIYISAPALENIKMVFEFIIHGLESLGYEKYKDFKIIYSFKSKKRLVQRIEILKNIKQTIEYHSPFEELKYHPDMLIVDEAAAIPLPLLKKLLFPNLIIMATTNSGYEGTGRAFSSKMAEYLRVQANEENHFAYKELFMNASIRYGENDPVEKWLNKTLLLNTEVSKISKCPIPSSCELYYIDKNVLFSGNSHSESILNDVFSLFIASHYKNSPDDIQILADSPNHEIFTLITSNEDDAALPRVLCAIHIAFEGRCERGSNKKGNLIPWIVSETNFDSDFIEYLGIRIIRIAVHPDYMSMGYGSYALELLMKWFKTNQHSSLTRLRIPTNDNENNVMFYDSNEILIPKISWIGTSFGVTERLLNFWKKHELIPICIKQKVSFITGENSIILMKSLDERLNDKLKKYYKNFKMRFTGQMAYNFRNLSAAICIVLLFNKVSTGIEDKIIFSEESCDRIERYCKGTIDILDIIDLLPLIARIYFSDQTNTCLSFLQQSVLLQIGCQQKSLDDVGKIHSLKVYEVNTILMKIMNLLKNDIIKK
ncbi:RNA cytidine acetlytransferase (KRE33) [Vairimorpha necatrix]|uniref:RNA cytidine acetlytransferase (KRE33) n=1 Tax=Vairimorpha necatrix TaxID=6039 RepID=A0AAX4JED6_9MICR